MTADDLARLELRHAAERIAIAAYAVGIARPHEPALGAALVEAARLVADVLADLQPEATAEPDPTAGTGSTGSPPDPLTSI